MTWAERSFGAYARYAEGCIDYHNVEKKADKELVYQELKRRWIAEWNTRPEGDRCSSHVNDTIYHLSHRVVEDLKRRKK